MVVPVLHFIQVTAVRECAGRGYILGERKKWLLVNIKYKINAYHQIQDGLNLEYYKRHEY